MVSILFVEDTEAMQKLYPLGLTEEGFDVTLAGDIESALTKLNGRTFDIILLDLMLPGMSGLDFLSAYPSLVKNTQVIILSNYDNQKLIERAKSLGAVDYLIKADYEPKALANYLKKLLHLDTDSPSGETPL